MRVLTVRQPWAWSIIFAGKDVENRSRNIAGSYRGPVLIHAALQAVPFEGPGEEAWDVPMYRDAHARETSVVRHRIDVRGAIIGVVDLVDVHSASILGGCGRLRHDCPEHGTCREHCSPWAMGPTAGGWFQHLVFENPRALDQPVPWKGGLGLRRASALELVGDYLVQAVPGCTCHRPVSGPHEPGCGVEPIAKLEAVSS